MLASLETAPAQDVVVLLLYLECELRMAVHLGEPVIDVVNKNCINFLDLVLPACITCS